MLFCVIVKVIGIEVVIIVVVVIFVVLVGMYSIKRVGEITCWSIYINRRRLDILQDERLSVLLEQQLFINNWNGNCLICNEMIRM